MDEDRRAAAFASVVDRLLSGQGAEARPEAPELQAVVDLAACLATTQFTPSQPSFQQELEQRLVRQWALQRGRVDRKHRIHPSFPSLRLQWKPVLVASLLALVLGVGAMLASPSLRAQVQQLLWSSVREASEAPAGQAKISMLPGTVPIRKAQRRAEFRILRPGYVPGGFELEGAIVYDRQHTLGEDGLPVLLTDGPTILLVYQSSAGGLIVEQYRPFSRIAESVHSGASQEVMVNGQQAIYVLGHWETDREGWFTGWAEDSDRLLFEVGEVAVRLQAWPPLGPDELAKIAASLK